MIKAFDAKEIHRSLRPDGGIMHAQVKIGDSMLMLAESMEKFPAVATTLNLYVLNSDEVYKKAIAAGGISLREPEDQFYGDRNAGVQDPSGNRWWISTHVKDVTAEEIEKGISAHS